MQRYIMPLVFLIGLSVLIMRLVLDSRFGTTTLFYLLIPFATSVLLYFFTKPLEGRSVGTAFVNHLRSSGIVFLLTSAFLMEGFLCVLFFMPIYFFMVIIGFLFAYLFRDKSSHKSVSLLVIVLALSIEGVLPQTSFPRYNEATFVTQTHQDVDQLKENMADDIHMPKQKDWFLRIFPLPDSVKAGSLAEGDIHNLHFTYKKWGFTNFSTGEMDILISKVGERHIQTQIIKNTAYFSHYTNIKGTEVFFTPLEEGGTQVSLTVKYERLLDPYWYFAPLQHLAAKQSARYLVDNIIVRGETYG